MAHMLIQRSSVCGLRMAEPKRSAVLVRVNDDRVKQGRTFSEQDSTMNGPASPPSTSQPNASSGPLYADEVSQQVRARPKSNMSKEMKAKLRQEYTSFGGSENTVLLGRRMPIIAAVSVEEQQTVTAEAAPSTSSSTGPVRSSKWAIDPSENLRSTPEHRFWTFLSMGLMGATFVQGVAGAHSLTDAAGVMASLLAAYVLSDLGTGIYHWGVDNYGDGNTPVFGRQIAAFQGHHQRPWTITEREFCNNVHQVFKPAAAPAALFLLLSFFAPPAVNAFTSSFLFLVCMSQQFHAWSHMKKSELPAAVIALQDANILISRKMHGAHHKSPFEGNYCIVSGLWNPLLDNTRFFRNMERFFHATTGVEPRCWHEPEYDWRELERPSA